MKKNILIILLHYMLFANSNGPNQGYANNAPNFNNCTSCHSGNVNTGDGSVTFSGLPDSYIPGETYEITVNVTGDNDRGYGFQAIAQSGETVAGVISLNPNSENAEMNGNYVQQSSPTTSGSWVFDWIAPSSDVGNVTFSVSGLATGGNSGNGGDEVYTHSFSVPAQVPLDFTGLFFSEYAEGSSNNKYLEIFNGTSETVSLDDVVILGNYNGNPWSETFTFETGASIDVGDVYVIASSQADATILALADETLAYADPWYIAAFNGDDVRALAQIDGGDTTILDMIGTLEGGDPGTGWDVAGVENGTAEHTLVRKAEVTQGNEGDWTSSAGTNEDDSEWHVLEQDNWEYLGSHPHEITVDGPSISIISPQDGATISSDQVSIEFSVSNFNIGSDGDNSDGHIHYVLDDNEPVMHYSIDPISLTDLDDGEHAFSIWLVDSNHDPLDPFIGDTLNFTTSHANDITAIYDIQFVSDPDTDDASPLDGEQVTIRGVVTGEFWGSNNNRNLVVQDAPGAWNGIQCYNYGGWDNFDWVDESGNSHSGPAEGDEVTLTGTVDEYYNLTELVDFTVGIVHGESELEIEPSVLTLSEVGEAYENCLIRLEDVSVSNDSLGYGEWSFTNDNGDTLIADDMWQYYYYPYIGQELKHVTGTLHYSFGNYKIQPRIARDVVEEGITRIQRVQQVLYSDLMKAPEDTESDKSYLLGDTVTVEGVVTMPTGLSNAGTGVKFIFADVNGGPWSGILSYDSDSSAFPYLFEGDLIQATGYIYEYTPGGGSAVSNMTELFITEPINILNAGQALPEVETLPTGNLRWPTEAEQWGTVMVRVENAVVTENDLPFDVFIADDGSGEILVDDDSDSLFAYFQEVGPPPIGTYISSMEGWVYHHYGDYADSNTYNLCPLYPEDIEFGSGPPSISGISREPCAPVNSDNEVSVSCVILDNSAITEALIHYSIDDGGYNTVAMTSEDDSVFTGVIPLSNDITVNYYITATDDGADQTEPKTSVYPYDIEYDQLGFIVTDNLFISDVQYTPWPSGNTRYEGCEVTVSGIVTADTAQYIGHGIGTTAYNSYALQDGEGPWGGLIFDTEEMVEVTRGDHVTITGLVTDFDPEWLYKFGGNTRLINAQVSDILQVGEQGPYMVSCEDIYQTADEVESYEGVLVKLNNVTISSVNLYDWSITDGTGFEALIDDDMANLDAFNSMDLLVEGQELDHVMGIFNYSYGTYKVQIRDVADLGQTVGIDDDVKVNPYDYVLHDNFPNPFNPETQIRFSIGSQEDVKLIIYDVMGRQVRTLIGGSTLGAGFHVMNWNGLDDKGQRVPSGMYVYRIKAGEFIADKKMLLVK